MQFIKIEFVSRPKESGENQIHCLPLEGSPKKPRSLLQMEAESLKLRHQRILVLF